MKILIISALYPPDIAPLAPYVKELAQRLKSNHTVTVLAYGHIPEAVEGVQIVAVEKNAPLFIRLLNFTKALLTHARTADIVYAQNGPSVEVPLFLMSLIRKKKIMFCHSDETALAHAKASVWYRVPFRLACAVSTCIITHTDTPDTEKMVGKTYVDIPQPHTKPEIHSLLPYPHDALRAYATSWNEHMHALTLLFSRI